MLLLERNKVKDLAPLVAATKADVEGADPTIGMSTVALGASPLGTAPCTTLAAVIAGKLAKGPMRFAPYLRLYLAGNPLSDAAKTQQLPALKNIGVRIEG